MKNCNEIKNLLSEYLDGETDNTPGIQKHLESCADCRKEFERLKKTARTVKDHLVKDKLPESFNQRLMKKIQEPCTSRFSFKIFIPRLAYTVVVILILLGIVFYVPIKEKFAFKPAKQIEQTVVYFTQSDHQEAEKIFLVSSNDVEDEEVLINLFAENNEF